jgi:hypothetical protein
MFPAVLESHQRAFVRPKGLKGWTSGQRRFSHHHTSSRSRLLHTSTRSFRRLSTIQNSLQQRTTSIDISPIETALVKMAIAKSPLCRLLLLLASFVLLSMPSYAQLPNLDLTSGRGTVVRVDALAIVENID